MFKQKLQRGFTLIELLVVIAIIGILASVVLASLNTARDKGQDAANQSSVNNMRAQMELYYDDNGNSYAGACTAADGDNNTYTGSADDTIADALANSGATCIDSATAYAIAVDLVATPGDAYCVDSSGISEENTVTASAEADDTSCDGA